MRALPRTEEAENSPPPLGQAADAQLDHRHDASNVVADYIMIRGKPMGLGVYEGNQQELFELRRLI